MSNPADINPSNSTELFPCSVIGQKDIFGMGIRISLYMQWYTTILAYLYDPELATECTIVNYCFSIAVAIASIAHPKAIHAHEAVIVAIILLVPPTIILVALADNFLSVVRPAKPVQAPAIDQTREKSNPNMPEPDPNDLSNPTAGDPSVRAVDPNVPSTSHKKTHSKADWLRDVAVVLATAFILVISVWELFVGVKFAEQAEGCRPMFIYSHYLRGRYNRLMKSVAIMSCIITPLVLIFLLYLRTTPKKEVTGLLELSTADPPGTQGEWRDRLIYIDSLYSPLRSDTHVVGPVRVRNVVAFLWALIVTYVIAQTETIIKQNRLQDVMDPTETGQLIPLTIGICNFGIISYSAWGRWNVSEKKKAEANQEAIAVAMAATPSRTATTTFAPGIAA